MQEPGVLGLEHEYSLFECELQVAFADVLHSRSPSPPYLDPDDPIAYWVGGGFEITADGREAEVAAPPIVLGPLFTKRVARRARAGAALLDALLPSGVCRVGYSTHLSIATPPSV